MLVAIEWIAYQCVATVLGDEADPHAIASDGVRITTGRPSTSMSPLTLAAPGAEHGWADHTDSRAEQSEHTEDLAASDVEADVVDNATPGDHR